MIKQICSDAHSITLTIFLVSLKIIFHSTLGGDQ